MAEDPYTPDHVDDKQFEQQIRYCHECGVKNIGSKNFCVYCGAMLGSFQKYCTACGAIIHLQKYCETCGTPIEFNVQNTSYTGTRTIVPREAYYPYRRERRPAWWKIPSFHTLMAIFGLILALEILLTLPLLFFVTDYENYLIEVLLLIGSRLAQLAIIAKVLRNFKGYKNFSKPVMENNDLSNENKKTLGESFPILKKKPGEMIGFIIVLVIGLFLIDTVLSVIIELVKIFLGTDSHVVSPYGEISGTWDVFFIFSLIAVFFAPFHEELLFRGYLQKALDRSGTPDWIHYVIQAVGFALLHLPGDIAAGSTWDFIFLHMIGTGVFALAATWLRKKYDSVLPSMVIHGVSNGLYTAIVLITRILPPDTDFFAFDLLVFFVVVITGFLVMLLLYLSRTWKPSVPRSFKDITMDMKNFTFLFAMVGTMAIIELVQGFIIFILNVSILVLLGYSIIVIIVFIIWADQIIDKKWTEISF
ncbi:MAG: CPBP family glutamic-type intramembrane protease [Candidatus Hodarchaeales archaeon]